MKRLEKLPAEETLKFLHQVVDGVCGRAYPRYQDYNTVWNLTEWMEVLEQVTTYFKSTVGKNLSDEESFDNRCQARFRDHCTTSRNFNLNALQQLSELSSDSQRVIVTCLKGRKPDIRRALIQRTDAISSAQLQNFDWQLKLSLSSDKLSVLQMPLLNLDLDVSENGDPKQFSIEMNKEELQNLLSALEAANKVVLQLK